MLHPIRALVEGFHGIGQIRLQAAQFISVFRAFMTE
jgi:hypothetical protein